MAFTPRFGFGGVKGGNVPKMPIDVDILPNPVIMVGQMEGLAASIRSAREPLTEAVKEVVIPSIWENFAQEGRPQAWERLAPATVLIREEEGFNGSGPILQRTTKLFKAATAFARWTIQKDMAYVSNFPASVWYAGIHQAGATFDVQVKPVKELPPVIANIGGRSGDVQSFGIPARPFMLIQKGDEKDIQDVFARWVMRKAATHGFVAGGV